MWSPRTGAAHGRGSPSTSRSSRRKCYRRLPRRGEDIIASGKSAHAPPCEAHTHARRERASPLKNALRPKLLATQARKGAASVNSTSVLPDSTSASEKASAYRYTSGTTAERAR
eukprot:scaffold35517_cov60-Phaeocystis_antarctica.AAC.4